MPRRRWVPKPSPWPLISLGDPGHRGQPGTHRGQFVGGDPLAAACVGAEAGRTGGGPKDFGVHVRSFFVAACCFAFLFSSSVLWLSGPLVSLVI